RIVVSGLASKPSGSQRATPIRVDPTSTASRVPVLNHQPRALANSHARGVAPVPRYGCNTVSRYATRSRHVSHNSPTRLKGLVNRCGGAVAERRSAARGDVVAAAAATAEAGRRLPD